MRHGHIPGAINHYWQDDLTQEGFGHVWKPAAELRRAYAAQGITPDKDIIAYCNSATEASHVHFTLRYLLGYPRVRIYVGSWTEWAEDERLAGGDRPAALAYRIAIPLRSCPGRQIRPAPHHQLHRIQIVDVLQRILAEQHEVGVVAGLDGADLACRARRRWRGRHRAWRQGAPRWASGRSNPPAAAARRRATPARRRGRRRRDRCRR